MAINIYTENANNNRWITVWNSTLAPLWYSIKQWFAVFLITSGTLYASVLFSMQHNIFPWYIATPIAIGITWTYLSGLAYATAIQAKSMWTTPMILVGALTDGLFGILYVLGIYKVIPELPDQITSIALASAHIIPLILLLVIFTYCKRNYLLEKSANDRAEKTRLQQIEDRNRERQELWRDKKLALDIQKDQLALDKERAKLSLVAKTKVCKRCNAQLSNKQYAAMCRWGYCMQCKNAEINDSNAT